MARPTQAAKPLMSRIHAKRLLKLVARLRRVNPLTFDIGAFGKKCRASPCGTTACAFGMAGEMPEFKRLGLSLRWHNGYADVVLRPVTARAKTECRLRTKELNNRRSSWAQNFSAAAILFGLTEEQSLDLFDPSNYRTGHGTTAKQVAKRIVTLVKSYYPDLVKQRSAS